jgi:hypothetical protein
MTSTGVDPRTLCLEFDIQHTTLRAIQSGYANYKRHGGNEGKVGVLRPVQDLPG